jgi:cytochrome c-type biogenesis protein CcmH/NrfF
VILLIFIDICVKKLDFIFLFNILVIVCGDISSWILYMKKSIIIFLSAIIIMLGQALNVSAVEYPVEIHGIFSQVKCLVCKGESIKDSNSGLAVAMKESIRLLHDQGMSEKEILKYIKTRYGDDIIMAKSDNHRLLLLLPLVMIIITIRFAVKDFLSRT